MIYKVETIKFLGVLTVFLWPNFIIPDTETKMYLSLNMSDWVINIME
jgi:hypothetical protein